MINNLKENIFEKVEKMEEKHVQERFRLATIKKSYRQMVNLHGEKRVEKQMMLSKAHADRYAFIQNPRRKPTPYEGPIKIRPGKNKMFERKTKYIQRSFGDDEIY